MSKRIRTTLAMILILAMTFNIASCSAVEDFLNLDHGRSNSERHHRDRDDDDDDEDDDEDDEDEDDEDPEETEETEVSGPTNTPAPISDELTYPDHVPTYDEIHPSHPNGTVRGQAAVDILNDLELQIVQESLDSYVYANIFFEHPEDYGIDITDVSWGSVSTDHEQDVADNNEALELLYSIDRNSLGEADKIFYDKLLYDLELSAYYLQWTAFDYYESILKPLTGPQSEVLFILDVLEFDTEEDAENYIEVLRDTDRYYDEMCDFEEERASLGYVNTDEVYEEVAESFDALVAQQDDCFLYESFEERLDNIQGLSAARKQELIDEHYDVMQNVVFPEFEECADRMRALKCGAPDIGVCQYPGGDAYFAYIFYTQTNSGRTIEESIAQVEAYADSIMTTMNNIAYGGDLSWYNEYVSHDYSMGDTNDNLVYLYDMIQDDFPMVPAHDYRLMDVPEVFADSFSPAAYLGYHLDDYNSNLILTNRASITDTFGVTCAHEGYPGHMYQSLYLRNSTNHPYMYLADSIGYTEGWATYVENYSFKYFSITSASELVRIENVLNVVLFARFDLGVNYEGWSAQDCADWYSDISGMSAGASMFMDAYELLLSDPGYGIKYGLGFINTGLVMAQLHNDFPDATDIEIHTAYLNAQTGTFEQILENARAYLEEGVVVPAGNWPSNGQGASGNSTGGNSGTNTGTPTPTPAASSGSGLLGH